jgi:hypothetical protein
MITLDCVDEFSGIDETPPHFFASGLRDTQTRYWIALPADPRYPPDPCRITTLAGITSVPPIDSEDQCGAASVPTAPVIGGFVGCPTPAIN